VTRVGRSLREALRSFRETLKKQKSKIGRKEPPEKKRRSKGKRCGDARGSRGVKKEKKSSVEAATSPQGANGGTCEGTTRGRGGRTPIV